MFDLSTGNPKIDAILQIIGALYLLLSLLTRVLPAQWRVTQVLAKVVADMRRAGAKVPADPEEPKP